LRLAPSGQQLELRRHRELHEDLHLAAPSFRFLSSGDLDRNGKTDLVGSGDAREIDVFLAR
jgi:hypothetical protein